MNKINIWIVIGSDDNWSEEYFLSLEDAKTHLDWNCDLEDHGGWRIMKFEEVSDEEKR